MKTIKENIMSELVIKNSKFITYLFKISSPNEINLYLEKLKEEYPDATHHCYAWILDKDMKSSDDGEPGGTAGLPMLNVLLKNELTNILAVTIRYFGGIKLGASGLVRAYTKSLTSTFEKVQVVNLIQAYEIELTINYDQTKNLDYLLKDQLIIKKEYGDTITYLIKIPTTFYPKLSAYNPKIISETTIEES
ncbi:MAG: YigZ family protein [Tenericutes bacterium]|nr:YigZ family protein [Mycoplasmatota bacterium]